MRTTVIAIAVSPFYAAALAFFAYYPLLSAVMWIWTSLIYFARRERGANEEFYTVPENELPMVSVVVPSYYEELNAGRTIEAVLAIDYPRLEVIVVDDGSGDRTLPIERSHLSDPRLRVVHKEVNEGKALAINDAMPLLSGELLLVVDGDSSPHPDVLRWMVPHFVRNPRLGAVTGNPRVRNHEALLAKIQTVEFSSVISLLKRAQTVWGRVMTVSGVLALYRVSAIEAVGLFVHDAVTEDMTTSWELQRRHFDIRYEPRSMVDMQVPPTLRGLWKQRYRWARGLAQLLRRNVDIFANVHARGLYPVFIEASLSIVWAYCFVGLTAMWLVTWIAGAPLLGATPVPSWWGMLIGTTSLAQLGLGVWMDRKYDPRVTAYYAWAALYPVIYWIQMAVVTVVATPRGLTQPYSSGKWRTIRFVESE